jgi:hypothetical protein
MASLQHKTNLSANELLQAVAQLKPHELERFVKEAIALQARRSAPSLSHTETELMLKINQGLPPRVQRRFDELVEKRNTETLTLKEHEELLRLVNRKEKLNARRIEFLADLAKLKQLTLRELMENLGIGQMDNA